MENLNPGDFKYEVDRKRITKFTKYLKKFIENLEIGKLKTPKVKEEIFKVKNFSSHDCEHVNLEFLRYLENLKTLSIEFNPGILKKNYERRVFGVAIADIKNLSNAIEDLENLEKIEIKNSNLKESEKIEDLLTSLESLNNLTSLSLRNCNITSGSSGEAFQKFLVENSSIKYIDLKNNELNYEFCVFFSNGISGSKSKFDFLGLSFNPILLDGLSLILNSIHKKDNVNHLDISNCCGGVLDTYENFTEEFRKLLKITKNMKFLNFTNLEIPNEELRQIIIQAFNSNSSLINFSFHPNGKFHLISFTCTFLFTLFIVPQRFSII